MLKPLWIIAQPRNIQFLLQEFRKIDFVDKIFVKYHRDMAFYDFANTYFRDHSDYTHLILCPDDLQVNIGGIIRLLRDINEEDYPVLAGVSNYCNVWQTPDLVCTYCRSQRPHQYTNVCFEPTWVDEKTNWTHYPFVTLEFLNENRGIHRVAFQGFSPVIVRRDIALKIPFRPVSDTFLGCQDIAFSADCNRLGVDQYADFHVFFQHWGLFHNDILVGKATPDKEFTPAKRPIEDVLCYKIRRGN